MLAYRTGLVRLVNKFYALFFSCNKFVPKKKHLYSSQNHTSVLYVQVRGDYATLHYAKYCKGRKVFDAKTSFGGKMAHRSIGHSCKVDYAELARWLVSSPDKSAH